MAAWLPIVKIVLPYVAPIFQAAIPAFNKRKGDREDPVVAEQIAELQEAVKAGAESTRTLAKALEELAVANDKAIRQARLVSLASIAVAVIALLAVAISWLR